MVRLLQSASRTGVLATVGSVIASQTQLSIAFVPDPAVLAASTGATAVSILVEQSPDGGTTWFTFGSCLCPDLKTALAGLDRFGQPKTAIRLAIVEQIYRDDVASRIGGLVTRRVIPTTTTRTYRQCEVNGTIRVTIDVHRRNATTRTGNATMTYAVDVDWADVLPPEILLGSNSASLLGTFTAADAGGVTNVTSGSRTTVAGSTIMGFGGCWDSATGQNNTISDSFSNNYAEASEGGAPANEARCTFAYNVDGTRGASHTVTNTKSGLGTNVSVGAAEFAGLGSSPTVTAATAATGTSTTPTSNAPATVAGNCLFVGQCIWQTGSLTIAQDAPFSLLQEVDEDNTNQAQAMSYKVATAGSVTASWTLSSSSGWRAALVSFTEAPVYFAAMGAVGSGGTTSVTVAYPTITAADKGKLLVLYVGNRPNANTPDDITGWTKGSATGGAGSEGAGTGTIRGTYFYKLSDGTESGTVTVTCTSGSSMFGRMFMYGSDRGMFSVAAVSGSDNSAGTSWSATAASDPGITVNDLIIMASINSEDTARAASEAISATGVTFGQVVERQDSGITTGNDLGMIVCDCIATAGTSSAAPVYTMTMSGTNAANSAGVTWFLRLRAMPLPAAEKVNQSVNRAGTY